MYTHFYQILDEKCKITPKQVYEWSMVIEEIHNVVLEKGWGTIHGLKKPGDFLNSFSHLFTLNKITCYLRMKTDTQEMEEEQ